MLSELIRQGVDTVVATPHFYATETTPDEFLQRRRRAYDALSAELSSMPIDLRLGAEIQYFEGLRNLSGIGDFCIEGTNLLLIEMPFSRWSERTVRTLCELTAKTGFDIVLAHIDRYLSMQPKKLWRQLADCGILMQINAESLLYPRTRRKVLHLFKTGCVHFIGTDCHNMNSRPPKMAEAISCIEDHLGKDAVFYLQDVQYDFFRCPKGVL